MAAQMQSMNQSMHLLQNNANAGGGTIPEMSHHPQQSDFNTIQPQNTSYHIKQMSRLGGVPTTSLPGNVNLAKRSSAATTSATLVKQKLGMASSISSGAQQKDYDYESTLR